MTMDEMKEADKSIASLMDYDFERHIEYKYLDTLRSRSIVEQQRIKAQFKRKFIHDL
jgi:hypothetical protein